MGLGKKVSGIRAADRQTQWRTVSRPSNRADEVIKAMVGLRRALRRPKLLLDRAMPPFKPAAMPTAFQRRRHRAEQAGRSYRLSRPGHCMANGEKG